MPTRRTFIGQTLSAAGLLGATHRLCLAQPQSGSPPATASAHDPSQHPIIIFAKPLEHFDFDVLGQRLQSIGVQGIEATLRDGGQIAPAEFAKQLPRLTEILAKYDQRIIIAASDINQATAESEQQLRQLAAVGIPYIRMQYYRYDFARPVLPQLDQAAQQAGELAALCKSLGIRALYQNHAGKNYVGAALWDLQQVLSEVDPQWLSVALDIRHTALELSQSWPSGYAAIRPHLGAVYVKDVSWINNQPENVPLGEGISQPLFRAIQRDGLIGPLSLHVEYIDHRDPSLQEQRWQAVVKDVQTLRRWIAATS